MSRTSNQTYWYLGEDISEVQGSFGPMESELDVLQMVLKSTVKVFRPRPFSLLMRCLGETSARLTHAAGAGALVRARRAV